MRKKRKIGFYYLTINSDTHEIKTVFNDIINSILALTKAERKYDINNEKFCFLDIANIQTDGNRAQLIFKSASHSFRPPLIDSLTIDERENPKRLEEGESNKTHVISKAINGDLILVVEKGKDLLSINQIVSYLNCFSHLLQYNDIQIRFGFEIIAKDNFIEEIRNLERVVCADIFVDKQLLGSAALDYSQRLSPIKSEISINVKANPRDSIKDFVNDLYAFFSGGNNSVKRIRIVGRNQDNNEVKINTDFIEKQEYIMVDFNQETGEILSNDIIREMNSVLINFN